MRTSNLATVFRVEAGYSFKKVVSVDKDHVASQHRSPSPEGSLLWQLQILPSQNSSLIAHNDFNAHYIYEM